MDCNFGNSCRKLPAYQRLAPQSAETEKEPDVAINRRAIIIGVLMGAGARAQQKAPSGNRLAEAASRRFPQPVRVGDLLHRTVLQPLESQPILGHVVDVVRFADGAIAVVVNYGGVFGIGARPIAVPVEAMALLGDQMEIVGFTPKQLSHFPTFTGAGAAPIAPDETIRVGLAKPSH